MQAVDAQVLGCAATTYCPAGDPAAEQALIARASGRRGGDGGDFRQRQTPRGSANWVWFGHAYEVVGYDADPASPTFGTFQLENPWGCYEPRRR